MRILFIVHGPYDCNSGVQIFHFANELVELGLEAAVCAPGPRERIERVGEPAFELLAPEELRRRRGGFDLIHAWTPREVVRKLAETAGGNDGTPLIVHLEDNEEILLAAHAGMPYEQIARLPPRWQKHATGEGAVHPRHYPEFMRSAFAVTVITRELSRFAPGRWELLRPGVDAERFSPEGPTVDRAELGIGAEEFVIVYPGNLHTPNEHDMFSLYLSVQLLRRRGHPVRLVRLGADFTGGPDVSFASLRDRTVELSPRPWTEVPAYLRVADALVQPGPPNEFNRFRLPAKVPEFLAMGKPVVLPDCNVGEELTDGVDALLLRVGNATEIADRLQGLIADRERAREIGARGREFALRAFDWRASSHKLADLYEEAVSS